GCFEFAIRSNFSAIAQRGANSSNALNQCLQLARLQRCAMIGSRQITIERKMLFNYASAERDGGDGYLDAGGVIGITHRNSKSFCHGLHRTEVNIRDAGWVIANAMQ